MKVEAKGGFQATKTSSTSVPIVCTFDIHVLILV